MSSILLQKLLELPDDAKTGFFRIFATASDIRAVDENGVVIPFNGSGGPPGPGGGNVFFLGSDAPGSGDGDVNDVWLAMGGSAKGSLYTKTGLAEWSFEGTISNLVTGASGTHARFGPDGSLTNSSIVNEIDGQLQENYSFDPSGPNGGGRVSNHFVDANGGSSAYQAQRFSTEVFGSGDWDAQFSRTIDASFGKSGPGEMGRHALYGGRVDINEGTVKEIRGLQGDLFLRNGSVLTESMSGVAVTLQVEDTSEAQTLVSFDSIINLDPGSEVDLASVFRSVGEIEGDISSYIGFDNSANFTGNLQSYIGTRSSPTLGGSVDFASGYIYAPGGVSSPVSNVAFGAFLDQVSDDNAQFGANVALQADQGVIIQFVERDLDDPPPAFPLPFQFGNLFFYEILCPVSRDGDSVQTVSGVNIRVEEDVEIGAGPLSIGLNSQLQFTGIEMGGGGAELEKVGSHLSIIVLEEPESGPSGGTIEEAWGYRALGAINPDGVSGVNLEEYTAFLFDPPLLFPQEADQFWGVKVKHPNAHNYLSRDLVISGTDEAPSNDDIALQIGEKKAIKLNSLSESERDALDTTDGDGMIALIDGGSAPGLQVYNGFEWVRAASPSVSWFSVPSDVTLNESHSTRTGFLTGDAVITLPPWSDVSDGYVVEIVSDGGSHTATVAVQGGDSVRLGRTQINGDMSIVRSPVPDLWVTLGEVSVP